MNDSTKFWDSLAKTTDKTEKRFEQVSNKIVENTKKYLKANDIALDLGCATGTKTLKLSGLVKEIHGIDISSKMIDTAKSSAAECNNKNTDFFQSTIFNERLKKESFDVILAFNILHLLEDAGKAVQRIRELLKPGGLFLSSTPCLNEKKSFLISMQFLPYNILSNLKIIPKIKLFKFIEIENFMTDHDFNIIEAEKIYHNLSGYFIAAKK